MTTLAEIDWEGLLRTYGYWALLIGTFLEGETILIIAGYLASTHGALNVWLAIAAAFAGSMSGDQLYFLIGRYRGGWLLARMPGLRPRIEKALRLLERHSTWLLLTFRFFYGLRNVTTFAVGLSRVRATRFAALNAVGAMIWALTFGLGGYLLGAAMERFIARYKFHALGGLCAVFFAIWLTRLILRKRAARRLRAGTDRAIL